MHPSITVRWADLTCADAALEAALPPAERDRLTGLTGADRARRAVGAALLLRAVGGQGVVVDRTCEECGGQHGRPVVRGGPWVSVAHAGVLVVVATCAGAPVGVDVERTARFDRTGEAAAWVAREARLKTGPGPDAGSVVLPLDPPLPGYAAAVAVRTTAPATVRVLDGRPLLSPGSTPPA